MSLWGHLSFKLLDNCHKELSQAILCSYKEWFIPTVMVQLHCRNNTPVLKTAHAVSTQSCNFLVGPHMDV